MIVCTELYSSCGPREMGEMQGPPGCGEFESIIAQLENVIYIWPFDMRFLNWFLCLFWVGHRSGMSYNHLSTATTPWCWPQTSCSTINTSWLDVSMCVSVSVSLEMFVFNPFWCTTTYETWTPISFDVAVGEELFLLQWCCESVLFHSLVHPCPETHHSAKLTQRSD